MLRVSGAIGRRIVATLLLGMSAASVQPSSRVLASSNENTDAADKSAQHATLKPISANSPDIPFIDYDSDAERQLLDLANQARKQAGAPLLTRDAGMSRAARIHAEAMFAARQLSHQFDGEPSLPKRLAASTSTQLDREGENVALDFDAADAQRNLMLSPPHRANLLNPDYNVIGLGVVRSGDRLYVVQDFGHALPTYSIAEVKAQIAESVGRTRREVHQADLPQQDLPITDTVACSMAQADKLGTSTVQQLAQRYSVLTYTSLHPEELPDNALPVLKSPNLRSFSIGACHARTETYPTGVYWVVLALE